jgi:uncharacterized membrane protein
VAPWTDEQFEVVLALVLRAGVAAAAAIEVIGGVVFLLAHGSERLSYHVFHGEPTMLRSVAGIIGGARRFDAGGLVQLGLLVLIATPIARVVFSVLGFVRQRDWLYVGVTLTVLGLLTYSLAVS